MKTIITGAFIALCITACIIPEKMKSKIDVTNLDVEVRPGDDFYEYANGGWMKKNPLTAEYARYGQFDALAEKNREQLKELVLEQAALENPAPGSEAKKIGDLYNLAMDSVRRNSEGYAPIQPLLDKVAAVSDRSQLLPLSAELMRQGISTAFHVFFEADIMNSRENLLQIYQGGLSLPEKSYYIDEDSVTVSIRDKFREHVVKMFMLCGFSEEQSKENMQAVMRIEKRIAEKSFDNVQQRDPAANYHKFTYDSLKTEYSTLPWDVFFDSLGIKGVSSVNVAQTEPLKEVAAIFEQEPLEDILAYMQWNVINSTAGELNDELSAQNFDFYGRTLSGAQEQRPRWKRALGVVNATLGEAVGKLYVAKYFPPAAKERMLALVGNLQKALAQRIDAQEWMSDSTKQFAHDKLNSFRVKIGYPDKWKNYDNLIIDPADSYAANCRRISEFMWDDMIARKHNKPVDVDEWYMTPQTVNAYYNPTTNEICFPAGILQYPFFDMDADDAFNYGAIGVVIGHEMTHGFDDQGRRFDKNGNFTDWWTEKDAESFNERTKVIINHFNDIYVLPDMKANGELTVGENIADHGGLTIAMQAFRNATENTEPLVLDGFTPEQRFYLAYANVWAGNIRDEEIRNRTKSDPHSLSRWRVNGTLPHIEDWYKAFGITADDKLYIPENKRLNIW
ncbi:MAG: M13 family metallopeptidase [Bacteroidaceae bacterium]|nr:M13 family metallopeptidase [Bacteroidaceae bacterium]